MSLPNELCSGSDYSVSHTPLLDHSTGTLVCTSCAHVLQEGLTYDEVHLSSCWRPNDQTSVMIDGEPAIEYLNKLGDLLHLCQSTIDNAYDTFLKTKKKMQKMLTSQTRQKNKRVLLNDKRIFLVYNVTDTICW